MKTEQEKATEVRIRIKKLNRKFLIRSPLLLAACCILPIISPRMGTRRMTDTIEYPYAVLIVLAIIVPFVMIGYINRRERIKEDSRMS